MRFALPTILSALLLASGAAFGGGDVPRCKASAPAQSLESLFAHWTSTSGSAHAEAGAALGSCLVTLGFPHSATRYWSETLQGATPEDGAPITRLWLPMELELGPDLRGDGHLRTTPILKVHRKERSRHLFLQNLLRFDEGSYPATLQGLQGVSGREKGLARLLLGAAFELTQAPSQALGAFHSALSGLGVEVDREALLQEDKARQSKRLKDLEELAAPMGVSPLMLPEDLPPLPRAWLIPEPHGRARLGLGRMSLALGQPEAARAYLSTLLSHPALGPEARLLSAKAAQADNAIATALSFLEPLSREGTYHALRAQLALREMTPHAKERAILFERSKSLSERLNKRRDALLDAAGIGGKTTLATIRAQEVSGEGPIPGEILTQLQGDISLHLLRRRLQEVELERVRLRAMGAAFGTTPLGRDLWEGLRHDEDTFSRAANARGFEIINAWSDALSEEQDSVPPTDIRDVLFSPSIYLD